jgi:hypothetical protein
MRPKTRALSSTPELVRASATLRAARLSAGDGATVPVDAWRLGHEGLLSWGLGAAATRRDASAFHWPMDVAADRQGSPAGQAHAEAAVVQLMAPMPRRSMPPGEGTSCPVPTIRPSTPITSAARPWCMSATRPCTRCWRMVHARRVKPDSRLPSRIEASRTPSSRALMLTWGNPAVVRRLAMAFSDSVPTSLWARSAS